MTYVMRRLFSFFRSGAQTAAESPKYTHPKRQPRHGVFPTLSHIRKIKA